MGSTYFATKFAISAIFLRAISDVFWSFFIIWLVGRQSLQQKMGAGKIIDK